MFYFELAEEGLELEIDEVPLGFDAGEGVWGIG